MGIGNYWSFKDSYGFSEGFYQKKSLSLVSADRQFFSNPKQFYYRVNDLDIGLKERVLLGIKVLVKTLITCGFFLLSSDTRSEWRQVFWGKHEVKIIGDDYNVLHYGSIKEQAVALRQFTHLKKIELRDLLSKRNLMEHTPEELNSDIFSNFKELETIEIDHNVLSEVPESILHLPKIKQISLTGNEILYLPESISNLSYLKELYVSSNHLTNLPNSLGKLKGLEKLSFGGNQIRHLPEAIGHLTSLTDLNASNNGLRDLPASIGNLNRLKNLDLSSNRFSTIPECLFRLPSTCEVNLERNQLDPRTVSEAQQRINAPDYNGPNFIFSIYEPASRQAVDPGTLKDRLPMWLDEPHREPLLKRLKEGQSSVSLYLSRMVETKDYQNQPTLVKKKVNEILTWLITCSEDDLTKALTIISDATATCGDRLGRSLNDLFLLKKISESPNMPLNELRKLVIGIQRYELLNDIAKKKCATMRACDPIEVHMRYETALKKRLGLPLEVSDMLYQSVANVSADEINEAEKQILAATPPHKDIEVLVNNLIWQKRLEKEPGFSKILQECESAKAKWRKAHEDQEEEPAVFKEFQEKEKNEWNPYRILTAKLLK